MQEKKYLKLKEEKLRGQEHWIEGSEEVGLENESKKRNKEGNQEKKKKDGRLWSYQRVKDKNEGKEDDIHGSRWRATMVAATTMVLGLARREWDCVRYWV